MLLPTKTNPSNKILFRFSFTPFVMGTPNLGVCCILCLSRVSGVQLAMGGSRVQVNKPHKSRFSSKSSRNIHKVSQKRHPLYSTSMIQSFLYLFFVISFFIFISFLNISFGNLEKNRNAKSD